MDLPFSLCGQPYKPVIFVLLSEVQTLNIYRKITSITFNTSYDNVIPSLTRILIHSV